MSFLHLQNVFHLGLIIHLNPPNDAMIISVLASWEFVSIIVFVSVDTLSIKKVPNTMKFY